MRYKSDRIMVFVVLNSFHFMIEQDFYRWRKKNHATFLCPQHERFQQTNEFKRLSHTPHALDLGLREEEKFYLGLTA